MHLDLSDSSLQFKQGLLVFLDAGPRAVNFIIDHAEIDFVFVQDKKVKEVRKVFLFSAYKSCRFSNLTCTSICSC